MTCYEVDWFVSILASGSRGESFSEGDYTLPEYVMKYDGSLYLNSGRVFMAESSLLWRSMRVAQDIGNNQLIDRIEECCETAEDGAGRSKLQYSIEVIHFQKEFAKSKTKGRIIYPEEFRRIPWLIWE